MCQEHTEIALKMTIYVLSFKIIKTFLELKLHQKEFRQYFWLPEVPIITGNLMALSFFMLKTDAIFKIFTFPFFLLICLIVKSFFFFPFFAHNQIL